MPKQKPELLSPSVLPLPNPVRLKAAKWAEGTS